LKHTFTERGVNPATGVAGFREHVGGAAQVV
jgi:hypothetical protein